MRRIARATFGSVVVIVVAGVFAWILTALGAQDFVRENRVGIAVFLLVAVFTLLFSILYRTE